MIPLSPLIGLNSFLPYVMLYCNPLISVPLLVLQYCCFSRVWIVAWLHMQHVYAPCITRMRRSFLIVPLAFR